jgi:hypothetical protein
VESHQPVTFPSCGSIKVFLETITIFLGFDSLFFLKHQEAAQALLSAALAGSQLPNIVERANDYILRAEQLKSANVV